MTRRIFRAVCTAALAVFFVTMALILGVLYDYFSNIQQNQLRSETTLAVQGVEQLGEQFFNGLSVKDYRITWIASDGTVLYDSASDTASMENHMERAEIKDALESGHGESARYSSTLMERSLYCADRLGDGTVLRLSISHGSVLLLILGMSQSILVIIAVAAVLAFLLANRLSKRIVEPLNRLNLDDPLENEEYDELSPLLRRIHIQQNQLAIQASRLKQKKQELDTIIGSLEEGMLLLDAKNNVLTINTAARAFLDLSRIYPEQNILEVSRNFALQEAVQTAAAGESCTKVAELNGKIIQISASPIQTDEKVSGTAVVLFDITQREQAEQQRREFTANVSHELKTPLHSISGYSELLKCGIAKPEDVQYFAEKIYNEVQRLISLVEDIINLSHLDEGGNNLQWAVVDLLAVSGRIVSSLSDVASQNEVMITAEGENSTVYGVPELIHTMIYNLCDNAIKYNRTGGSVEVIVGKGKVSIKDSGIGIPQEHIDRIFERFYRVDKSHSKAVGGTGLGLSIVKHAALIHKAEVAVESVVGEGTTVTITFQEGE